MAADEFLTPGATDDAVVSAVNAGFLEAGPLDMDQATLDIDGDGILDTVTGAFHTGHESAMFVATDTDHDGIADSLKIVQGSGDYASFEYEADPTGQTGWHESGRGKLAD